MLIINGVEVLKNVYLLEANKKGKVSLYTDDHTVTRAQTGHTLVMDAATANKTFTLPTPVEADVGLEYEFVNVDTGRLTIAVAGANVKIADGGVSIYSDTDNYAAIRVRLVNALQWVVIGAHGTWTTAS